METGKKRVSLLVVFLIIITMLNLAIFIVFSLSLNKKMTNLGGTVEMILSTSTKKSLFIDHYMDMIDSINPKLDQLTRINILENIYEQCNKLKLEPKLVLAVIEQESRFVVNCKSVVGALGLMQIMPETANLVAGRYGIVDYDLRNVSDNIMIGCIYLADLFRWYKQPAKVLAAYYAGNRMDLGVTYSSEVLARIDKYKIDAE